MGLKKLNAMLGTGVLAALAFTGCDEQPVAPAEKSIEPNEPVGANPIRFREQALEGTDSVTGERTIRDPQTGETYLLNPNRKLMTAGPSGTALSKVGANIRSQVDRSGHLETRWYECASPTPTNHNTVSCQVEPGFLVVGGGAYADYGTGSGALLTESRPLDWNLNTWVASSKDHMRSCLHTLHVYVIGMRLKKSDGTYMSDYDLWNYSYMDTKTGSISSYPQSVVTAIYPIVTGGGARTNWSGAGNLLIRSAYLGSQWAGQGRDLSVVDRTTVTSYIISFKRSIPGVGNFAVNSISQSVNTPANFVGTAASSISSGSVLTGLGVDLNPNNLAVPPARFLIGIRPEFIGGYAFAVGYNKDHVVATPGTMTVQAIGLSL